ncbi:MAG: hypothetical protein ACHQ2F_01060 [Desulfobaccales bacterium]
MNQIAFKDKFIGFIDILGFKKMVEASEAKTGMPLLELLEMVKKLGAPEDRKRFEKHGPAICPQSAYIQRDLDFQVTQFSDSAIISSEISPSGVINLVGHCWGAVIELLAKGIMCRGYITRGPIYHIDTQAIGSGYQNAYLKESGVTAFRRNAEERGTPFVEVDQIVCDYVRDHGDPCVKMMFSRQVKDDGMVTALFPFSRLSHSFIIAGPGYNKFNPDEERRCNNNMRIMIQNVKDRIIKFIDQSNRSAVTKAEHYIAALDAQLEVCDRTDEIIAILNSPMPL